MSQTKVYLKDDEYFEQGRFQWFVSLNPIFVAPVRKLVVRHTIPKRLEVEIDITGRSLAPRMVFKPGGFPMGTQPGKIHELLMRGAVDNNTSPQNFRLCVYDGPAPLETWRQLEFQATYGPVDFHQGIKVEPEIRAYFEKDGHQLGPETARFTLTVNGEIEKTGDWSRVDEPGIKLDPDAQAWHDKNMKELAQADKAERQSATVKKAVDTGKSLASGMIEMVGNIHREAKNSAAEKKALEARKGSFQTEKDVMQIFGEVYKILQKPIGQFRFSLDGSTDTLELNARCAWTEDLPSWQNAERELHCTFNFEPHESGTTIHYDYFLYEVPPGSIYANQTVRIINGWIKALAEQK